MSSAPSAADGAKTKARETARNNPLENAKTLRNIYDIDDCKFPEWVLDEERWIVGSDKSHKFDDTIVVYDDDDELNQVKELVEQREPVNVEMNRYYTEANLEKNFGWKIGAYGNSTSSELYPNIGIYCHARVTNASGKEEKNVHVMNLIGYAFDSDRQPDYRYFLNTYGGSDKISLQDLDDLPEEKFKEDLIQRYRKIWLKACYICKFKNLKNLWYYGVGNSNFSKMLPTSLKGIENFYNEIFAEAFGIDPDDSLNKHSHIDPKDLKIPINFCIEYDIKVQNLQKEEKQTDEKSIPGVLFDSTISTPENTLYINAWDPWSIIGNENNMFKSLDAYWGRNSNMSVLGWSMTNSKLLPDIVGGGDSDRKSKILKMSDILADIQAAGGGGSSSPVSIDTPTPPSTPSTPRCKIDASGQSITDISVECQEDIFGSVTAPVIDPPTGTDEPKDMSNLVSAIGTDYSTKYAGENIMPAGSATLLYIGDTNLYSINQSGSTWSPGSETTTKIKYMIHASPAKSDNVERDITKDTISNSVMNSLILATKNGVETIFFPFIGGQIFFNTLKEKVDNVNKSVASYIPYDTDQHAKVLVKGVTDFYTNFKSSVIKEIYFVTFNTPEKKIETTDKSTGKKITIIIPEVKEHEAIAKAYTDAISHNSSLKDILKPSIKGNVISNAIYYSKSPNIKPNIAVVNAGNTNHGFAGGSGVADMCFAGLNDNNSYQTKLDTIKTKFIEAFTKYINDPTAASSPPPASETPNKPFAEVLTELVDKLSKDSENDADIKKLGITPLPDFLYPTDGEEADKKNLNSAQPDIDTMIKEFENAVTSDDTNFYLGACKSIEAAYELDMSLAGSDDNKKTRAKLLLNLRKNSLLLKVPARWDYKEMEMGEVSGPPDNLDELMNFSLQDTINYYWQEGGNEETRFKELNIDKEPVMNWNFEWIKTNHTINGVDKRFTKGISNQGNTCFFNAALQLLLCNEDFLQLMIQGNCQDNFIDSIKKSDIMNSEGDLMCSDEKFKRSKETIQILLSFFEKWLKNESFDDDGENQVVKIVKALSDVKDGGQGDSSEILIKLFENIDCCNENYILKFYNNSVISLKITEKYPKYESIDERVVNLDESSSPLILMKSKQIYELMNTKQVSEAACYVVNTNVQELIDYYTSEQQKQYNIPSDKLPEDKKMIYDYIKRLYKTEGAKESNIFGLLHVICSKIDKKDTDIDSLIRKTNNIDVSGDVSFNAIELIKDMSEFSGIKSDFETIHTFLNDNKNKFTKENINDQCKNITKISDFVLKVQDSLVNPSGTFTTTKTEFKKIGKYVILYLGDRSLRDSTSENSIKNLMSVEINKNITLNSNKYILQGYSVHIGKNPTGNSHYVFIKCDPKSGEEKLILDDSKITNVDSRTLDVKQRGVYSLIYKQEEPIVHSSPSGGGFKPTHNTITTHTASKSKHNSSFKVSSSKTKGKSRSRSHTQRVK